MLNSKNQKNCIKMLMIYIKKYRAYKNTIAGIIFHSILHLHEVGPK